jgi:hypothetical protein
MRRRIELRQWQASGGIFSASADGNLLVFGSGHDLHHGPFLWGGNTIAAARKSEPLRLVDNLTGDVLLQGPAAAVSALALSSDGRHIAWGEANGAVGIRDVSPQLPLLLYPGGLTSEDLATLWDTLAAPKSADAHQAMWTLAADPHATLGFFEKHLRPAQSDDAQVARLIAQLGSGTFVEREKATQELKRLAHVAADALEAARNKKPGSEVIRRIEQILEQIDRSRLTPDELRRLRALRVLTMIHNKAARDLIERLADGSPHAPLTQAAASALRRLP